MRDKNNQEIELGDVILYNNIKYYVVLDTVLGVTGYYLDDCKNNRISMFNLQPEELEKQKNMMPNNNKGFPLNDLINFSLILPNRNHRIHWIVT